MTMSESKKLVRKPVIVPVEGPIELNKSLYQDTMMDDLKDYIEYLEPDESKSKNRG